MLYLETLATAPRHALRLHTVPNTCLPLSWPPFSVLKIHDLLCITRLTTQLSKGVLQLSSRKLQPFYREQVRLSTFKHGTERKKRQRPIFHAPSCNWYGSAVQHNLNLARKATSLSIARSVMGLLYMGGGTAISHLKRDQGSDGRVEIAMDGKKGHL